MNVAAPPERVNGVVTMRENVKSCVQTAIIERQIVTLCPAIFAGSGNPKGPQPLNNRAKLPQLVHLTVVFADIRMSDIAVIEYY
jgi:hypothetical protein